MQEVVLNYNIQDQFGIKFFDMLTIYHNDDTISILESSLDSLELRGRGSIKVSHPRINNNDELAVITVGVSKIGVLFFTRFLKNNAKPFHLQRRSCLNIIRYINPSVRVNFEKFTNVSLFIGETIRQKDYRKMSLGAYMKKWGEHDKNVQEMHYEWKNSMKIERFANEPANSCSSECPENLKIENILERDIIETNNKQKV